jgi:putative Mg2+ transporter-C (MgtC) family protein
MQLPVDLDDIISTVVAALLGAAIGAEREWRRHPGGLRSCALVAAAACVFARIAVGHGGSNPGAALGAIASGVGFLGAGVILNQRGQVRGLSTAATFWAVAAIGTAAGVLEYVQSIILTVVVFFALSRCGHFPPGSSAGRRRKTVAPDDRVAVTAAVSPAANRRPPRSSPPAPYRRGSSLPVRRA